MLESSVRLLKNGPEMNSKYILGFSLHFIFSFSLCSSSCLKEKFHTDLLSSVLSPPAASVHPSQPPPGQFLVVYCAVRLHVPGQSVRHRVPLLLPAGLLGLPSVRLRLHVSLTPPCHKFVLLLFFFLGSSPPNCEVSVFQNIFPFVANGY